MRLKYAPVAQRIEQARSKRSVGGPIPSRGALVVLAQWLERLSVEEEAASSNLVHHPPYIKEKEIFLHLVRLIDNYQTFLFDKPTLKL